jgi:hypothetical protein
VNIASDAQLGTNQISVHQSLDGCEWNTNQLPYYVTPSKPVITGPDTVWWFNGKNPDQSGHPTQITLSTSAGSTTSWTVISGSSSVVLSAVGNTATLTSSGHEFSQHLGDVKVTVTVDGVTSDPFGVTSRTPTTLKNPTNINRPCTLEGKEGWERELHYRVTDNFNDLVTNAGANEAWSGTPVWPAPDSVGGSAGDGTFTDTIFVCAKPPDGLSPMPQSPQDPLGTTLVDTLSQIWCSGAQDSNEWGTACQGVQLQNGTVKHFLDHAEVTVP